MATKDPHIAYIDAHEELEKIQLAVRTATNHLKRKLALGYKLTPSDRFELKIFQQKVIDDTRRVQEAYLKEIES